MPHNNRTARAAQTVSTTTVYCTVQSSEYTLSESQMAPRRCA